MGERLVAADIHALQFPLSREHARRGGTWHPVLIALRGASGVCGIGEAGLAFGTGQRAVVALLEELLEQIVLGRNTEDHAAIWQSMQSDTFWGRTPGPIFGAAISAIDTALWDIAGHLADRPVWALLGVRRHRTLPCYASQIQNGWRTDGAWTLLHDPSDYGDAAARAAAEGYPCIKVNPVVVTPDGAYQAADALKHSLPKAVRDIAIARIGAIRTTAPEMKIAVELHGMMGANTATELIAALADDAVEFWEEPVDPAAVSELSSLAATCPPTARFALGERLYSSAQFEPFFERRLCALVQPDIGLAGGITGVLEIARLAERHGVGTQMHVCGTPLADQVAAHVGVGLKTTAWHETHVNARSAANRDIFDGGSWPIEGRLEPNDAAGFGIALNHGLIEKISRTVHVRV